MSAVYLRTRDIALTDKGMGAAARTLENLHMLSTMRLLAGKL
jgi:hypothetical protein